MNLMDLQEGFFCYGENSLGVMEDRDGIWRDSGRKTVTDNVSFAIDNFCPGSLKFHSITQRTLPKSVPVQTVINFNDIQIALISIFLNFISFRKFYNYCNS